MARFLCALLALLAACANPRYDRYDASQYRVSMEETDDAHLAHAAFLTEWAETDEGLPPGLAAELAFYLAITGKTVEADEWFALEVQRYPESKKFVNALRAISLGEGPDSVADDGGTTQSDS